MLEMLVLVGWVGPHSDGRFRGMGGCRCADMLYRLRRTHEEHSLCDCGKQERFVLSNDRSTSCVGRKVWPYVWWSCRNGEAGYAQTRSA